MTDVLLFVVTIALATVGAWSATLWIVGKLEG